MRKHKAVVLWAYSYFRCPERCSSTDTNNVCKRFFHPLIIHGKMLKSTELDTADTVTCVIEFCLHLS